MEIVDNYSIPRRIWRIIYPVLIYLGVSAVIGAVIGVVLSMSAAFDIVWSGDVIDETVLIGDIERIIGDNTMNILFTSSFILLAIFIPIWLKVRKRIRPSRNEGPVLAGGLTAVFFAAFSTLLMYLFSIIDVSRLFPTDALDLTELFTAGPFALQVLTVGIIVPIVEELCFRGIMMERMRWMPVWVCVLVQGVLFGLAHLNLFQASYAAVVGILLGLLYVKYRSMIVVIIGHAAFNIASLTLVEFGAEDLHVPTVLILSVAAIVVSAVLLIKQPGAQLIFITEPESILAGFAGHSAAEPAGPYGIQHQQEEYEHFPYEP